MKRNYKGEIISKINSKQVECIRLTVNGGFGDMKQRFHPYQDIIWIKMSASISEDQFIDMNHKILRRHSKIINETSAQFRQHKNGEYIMVRCDNCHESKPFHIEEEIDGTKVMNKDLDYEYNEPLKYALFHVFDYVGKKYDPLVAPKFYFPMSEEFGVDIPQLLKEKLPSDLSLAGYSNMIAMLSFLLMGNIRYDKWIEEFLDPMTSAIANVAQKRQSLFLFSKKGGFAKIFPVPMFGPPSSKMKIEYFRKRPGRINLLPVGGIFHRPKKIA